MPKFQRIRASSFFFTVFLKLKIHQILMEMKKNLEVKDADVAVRLLHRTFRSHYFQQVKNYK